MPQARRTPPVAAMHAAVAAGGRSGPARCAHLARSRCMNAGSVHSCDAALAVCTHSESAGYVCVWRSAWHLRTRRAPAPTAGHELFMEPPGPFFRAGSHRALIGLSSGLSSTRRVRSPHGPAVRRLLADTHGNLKLLR